MVSVKWSEDSLKDLAALDSIIAKRIVEKALWLEENFGEIVPEKLRRDLRNLYKLRVGDYRVIYSYHQETITVQAVGHRRDIYR